METKILKATQKGQITLPKKWRSKFSTGNFVAEIKNNEIVIKPLEMEEVIFDAGTDNDGEPVSVDEMLKKLKSIRNG